MLCAVSTEKGSNIDMAEYTTKLNLEKPDGNENFRRQVLNDNMDKIDVAVEEAEANLGAVQTNLTSHMADYIRQPGYGVTAGSVNTYTLALSPVLTAYTAGVCVAVRIHAANTGSSTININGLGARTIKDSKGNNLIAGKLVLNSVYTLRYDGTNFMLQGEGGEYGTATASQVLTGYTIGTDAGIISGSMPNRGAAVITPGAQNQAILAGYHNGSGYVAGSTNLIAENIKKGVSVFGVTGTCDDRFTVTPGDNIIGTWGGSTTVTSTTYGAVYTIRVFINGSVRVRFTLHGQGGDYFETVAYGRIYKNEAAVGIEHPYTMGDGSVSAPSGYTEDIDVRADDRISLYARVTRSSYRVLVSSYRILVAETLIFTSSPA